MDARNHQGHGRFSKDLKDGIGRIEDLLATARHWLTDDAEQLVSWFREERKRIQAGMKDGKGRMPKGMFAPLNLYLKGGGDRTLELYWVKKFVGRDGKKYGSNYLPKGDGTLYPEYSLLKLAKPYEIDLILQTEEKAEVIRRRWKWLAACERATEGLGIDVAANMRFGSKSRGVRAGADADPALDAGLAGLLRDGHMECVTPDDLLDTKDRFKPV